MPVNADVGTIDVHFVDEHDPHVNPIGAKGIGEIGITGVAASIANAVFHATGKRVRELAVARRKGDVVEGARGASFGSPRGERGVSFGRPRVSGACPSGRPAAHSAAVSRCAAEPPRCAPIRTPSVPTGGQMDENGPGSHSA